MRLYSIQSPSVIESAERRGYLTGGIDYLDDEIFRVAYEWMRMQMARRIANFSGDYPVWAWVKRPDLRRSGHEKRGTHMLMLTLEIPKRRVLVSDFEGWVYAPINDHYLCEGEEEDARLRRRENPPSEEERRQSWEKIFKPPRHPGWYGDGDWWQACVDRVYLQEIVARRLFIAR